MKAFTATANPVGADAPANAYFVEALIGNGRVAYHRGPQNVAFFTKEQAERVAAQVRVAGHINPQHWMNARGGIFR